MNEDEKKFTLNFHPRAYGERSKQLLELYKMNTLGKSAVILSMNHGNIYNQKAVDNLVKIEREKTSKAFGSCTNCYGKGYATVRETVSGGHGRSAVHEVLPLMRFCECERGRQLKAIIQNHCDKR